MIALAACAHPQQNLDAAFRDVINARNDAIARADTAALHRGITDDMEWVIGATGTPLHAAQFLSACSQLQTPAPEFTIDSVDARDLGGVATVTYRRRDRRRINNFEKSNWTRALEVYVRRGDRWLLAQHSHTWIVQPATAIPMDSAPLAAFVGHYQIGDGVADTVHFEGGHLVATLTGQTTGGVLLPVSESAFSPDGVAPLIVFERNATGHVIGYVQGAPDGSMVRARRLP